MTPKAASINKVLRVDRDHGPAFGQSPSDRLVDVTELRVPVRMVRPLLDLLIPLEAEVHLA